MLTPSKSNLNLGKMALLAIFTLSALARTVAYSEQQRSKPILLSLNTDPGTFLQYENQTMVMSETRGLAQRKWLKTKTMESIKSVNEGNLLTWSTTILGGASNAPHKFGVRTGERTIHITNPQGTVSSTIGKVHTTGALKTTTRELLTDLLARLSLAFDGKPVKEGASWHQVIPSGFRSPARPSQLLVEYRLVELEETDGKTIAKIIMNCNFPITVELKDLKNSILVSGKIEMHGTYWFDSKLRALIRRETAIQSDLTLESEIETSDGYIQKVETFNEKMKTVGILRDFKAGIPVKYRPSIPGSATGSA